MPRYLAIDYFYQASRKYQELMHETILPVPTYLENSVNYPHLGKITDDSYRTPWEKVNSDFGFLQKESEKTKQTLQELSLLLRPSAEETVVDDWCCDKTVDIISDTFNNYLVNDLETIDLHKKKSYLELDDPREFPEPFVQAYSPDLLRLRPNFETMRKKLPSFAIEDVFSDNDKEKTIELDLFLSDNEYKDSIPEWKFEEKQSCFNNLDFAELPELLPEIQEELRNYKKLTSYESLKADQCDQNKEKIVYGEFHNEGQTNHEETYGEARVLPMTKDISSEDRCCQSPNVSLPPLMKRAESQSQTPIPVYVISDNSSETSYSGVHENALDTSILDIQSNEKYYEIKTSSAKDELPGDVTLEKTYEECQSSPYSENEVNQVCMMAYENMETSIPRNDQAKERCYTTEERVHEETTNYIRKEEIITVKLTGEYKAALQLMQNYGSDLIRDIWKFSNGVLNTNTDIINLSPDVTNSVLYQTKTELNLHREVNYNKENAVYYKLLALHGVLICKEHLLKCDISAAVEYLKDFIKSHTLELKDSLHQIIYELSSAYQNLQMSGNNLSPKLAELIKYLKKRQIENEEFRILLIVKTSHINCRIIKNAIEENTRIKVEIFSIAERVKLSNFKPQANSVAISNLATAYSTCSQFSVVIEYESDEHSRWKTACRQYHKEYVSFKIEVYKDILDPTSKYLEKNDDEDKNRFTLIGSCKVTENNNLLYLLESRYYMTIIERNYERYNCWRGKETLYFADIVVNEKTGILIETIDYYKRGDCELYGLTRKIKCLGLKYEIIWLIATISECSQALPEHQLLKKLSSWAMPNEFKIQVIYARGVEEIAEKVYYITKQTYQKRYIPSSCLSKEATKDEQFMLTLPCLNSYCAQSMLSRASLKDLMTMTWDELNEACSEISKKVLKLFYYLVSQPAVLRDAGLLADSPQPRVFGIPNSDEITLCNINTFPSEFSANCESPNDLHSSPCNFFEKAVEREFSEQPIETTSPTDVSSYDLSHFGKIGSATRGNQNKSLDQNVTKRDAYSFNVVSANVRKVKKLADLNKKLCDKYANCGNVSNSSSRTICSQGAMNSNILFPSIEYPNSSQYFVQSEKSRISLGAIGIAHPFCKTEFDSEYSATQFDVEDSPPMDLNSDEEDFLIKTDEIHNISRHCTNRFENNTDDVNDSAKDQVKCFERERYFHSSDGRLLLSPQKPRLRYRKVSGRMGQTQLDFS